MNIKKILLFNLLLFLSVITFPLFANKGNAHLATAEIELSKTSFYQGEVIIATLMLNCTDSELGYLRNNPSISIDKGSFAMLVPINQAVVPVIDRDNNGLVRKYPIAQYAMSIDAIGKKLISVSDISAGINYPVIVQHPFWGNYETYKTDPLQLSFKPKEVTVKSLPPNKKEVPFSGAIGNFEISTILPTSQFVINETSTIYIAIEGSGYLPDEIMPEYTQAFGKDIVLKSISGTTESFFNGKSVITRKTWECEVLPKKTGELKIGPVSLGYFNVETSQYQLTESKPITINVESSTIRRETIDI